MRYSYLCDKILWILVCQPNKFEKNTVDNDILKQLWLMNNPLKDEVSAGARKKFSLTLSARVQSALFANLALMIMYYSYSIIISFKW